MGTHALVHLVENEKILVSLYFHNAGYFEGLGVTLATFVKGIKLVNGYNPFSPTAQANGAGCLFAQIIAEFKVGVGGVYICSQDMDDYEYKYIIKCDNKNILFEAFEGDEKKYSGTCHDFIQD